MIQWPAEHIPRPCGHDLAQLARVPVRFRAGFAHLDGELNEGCRLPLCRLRFTGVLHSWGFALYLVSRGSYQDNSLPSGLPVGSPIELMIRRLFCDSPDCVRVTFAEQVEGLTVSYGRRTPLLGRLLEAIGVVLSGRPGARLAELLPAPVSRTTMLRLLMALPGPVAGTPRVLGIDDFALKRGHVYGSILVNCETGEPVDVLEDRESDTAAAWLRDHPGVEIICRDRAGAYASAAQAAAPDAIQVVDRFHVWKNLCENVEKAVASHRSGLATAAGEPAPAPDPTVDVVLPEGDRAAAVRQRYADVHALWDKGVGIGLIADRLGLDRKTVRRYSHADTVEHMLVPPRLGRRALVRYVACLNQRWSESCTDSGRLFRELQELGYAGSSRSVRRWLEPLCTLDGPLARIPETPTVRQVSTWLTRHPDGLRSDESLGLKRVLDHCPELADTSAHVREFAKIMNQLDGTRRLPVWIERAEEAELPLIRSFARNLRNDLPAVIQGLSTPCNSGIVEGRVTDIKAIKRQMAGRAGFQLLRKRILLVAASRRPPGVTATTVP